MANEVLKAEHILVAQPMPARITVRFAAFLAFCLFLHAALVYLMLTYSFPVVVPDPEPISVEIVPEPPPEEKPPQAPEEKTQLPEPPPPPVQDQQQPMKMSVLDEKPATDAPRQSEGDDGHGDKKVEAKSPEAPKKAAPTAPPKSEPAEQPPAEANREPSPEPRPDAETIEQAAIKPVEQKPTPTPKQADPAPKYNSVADQFAALEPLPNMEFSSPGRHTPGPTGNADPGYLTTIYGLIMQKIRPPPPTGLPRTHQGVVEFVVGPNGRLMGARMTTSSGIPALDSAALTAVLRAGPYPPPPGGGALALTFGY